MALLWLNRCLLWLLLVVGLLCVLVLLSKVCHGVDLLRVFVAFPGHTHLFEG